MTSGADPQSIRALVKGLSFHEELHTIILVRHLPTRNNLPPKWVDGEETFIAQGGGTDAPIDNDKKEPLLYGMRRALSLLPEVDKILCSWQLRAIQTAAHCGYIKGDIEITKDLCERDFYQHELKRLPKKAFWNDWPGTEKIRVVGDRIISAFSNDKPKSILAFTHGLVNLIAGEICGITMNSIQRESGRVFILQKIDGVWRGSIVAPPVVPVAFVHRKETDRDEELDDASVGRLNHLFESDGLPLPGEVQVRRTQQIGRMSAIVELPDGSDKMFDLDISRELGEGDLVKEVALAVLAMMQRETDIPLNILLEPRLHYQDEKAIKKLQRIMDEISKLGDQWKLTFRRIELEPYEQNLELQQLRAVLAQPRGISTTSRNRVIMVSGANRGIGRAICIVLIKSGYLVSAGARNPDKLFGVYGDQLERMLFCRYDAVDNDTHKAWVDATLEKFGRIDGVVNNAGSGGDGRVMLMDDNSTGMHSILQIHALGPQNLLRLSLPHIEASGSGRIVFINSLSGSRIKDSANVGYAMAKSAQQALCRTVHDQFYKSGVRTTSINPGWVNTEMGSRAPLAPAERIQPEAIAKLVLTAIELPNNAQVGQICVNCEREPI